jgi:hypothetical protein
MAAVCHAQGQNEPEISPLKGFHIPPKPKMPQTQADLAVYVKSLLVQMVHSQHNRPTDPPERNRWSCQKLKQCYTQIL